MLLASQMSRSILVAGDENMASGWDVYACFMSKRMRLVGEDRFQSG